MKFRKSAGVTAVILSLILAAGCSDNRIALITNGEAEETATPVMEHLVAIGPVIPVPQGDGETPAAQTTQEAVPETTAPETTVPEPTTVEPTTSEPTTKAPDTTETTKTPETTKAASQELFHDTQTSASGTRVTHYVGKTALAHVPNFVNVRSGPSTQDEVVGKIYNDCAADILDEVAGEDGSWFKIRSGNCEGYIKAEYFLVGRDAEEKREEVGILMGTVIVDSLRVRSEPNLEDPDNVFTQYLYGTEVIIEEMTEDGWAKIKTDEASVGYVYGECMEIKKVFKTAITIEEEEAELERQRLAEEAAREAEAALRAAYEAEEASKAAASREAASRAERESREAASRAERESREAASRAAEQASTEAPQSGETDPHEEPTVPESTKHEEPQPQTPSTDSKTALREAVCAYALQYVGHPYVHGGRSLETGTDCSGFTSLVYQHFYDYIGYRLSYAPENQQYQGTLVMNAPVDINQLLPGDLLFWPSSYKSVGHVGIYLGNNRFIHAASPERGVCLETFTSYRPALFARRIIN